MPTWFPRASICEPAAQETQYQQPGPVQAAASASQKHESERSHLLPEVHREAHVPNVTLAVIEASQNRHVRLVGFDVVDVVLHLSRFPADDGVLAGLPSNQRQRPFESQKVFRTFYFTAPTHKDTFWTHLGKNQVPEPPHTVHVVSVDVSS